ncbi:MAG: carbohydrate ABC transporter permease [Acetobacteraceae bacterium]
MDGTQQALVAGSPGAITRLRRRGWGRGLRGSEYNWAIAFTVPYAAIFLAFVVYPVGFGLWMGHSPELYRELFNDGTYLRTVANTLLYVGIGVNVKMFFAFLLSGFFMRRQWWVRTLFLIYILPWAMPALPTAISFHWLLNGQWGLFNNLLYFLTGIDGPIWLNSRGTALASNIVAYIWKFMPFWTVIFLAGRMAIPRELYEAADVDGATGDRRFRYVTVPLLANLYLICTLLSTVFTVGDFTTVYFVSGGGPAMSTDVLATLGIREAFIVAKPDLGVAVVMTALPVLIPLVIYLMRKLRMTEVQL